MGSVLVVWWAFLVLHEVATRCAPEGLSEVSLVRADARAVAGPLPRLHWRASKRVERVFAMSRLINVDITLVARQDGRRRRCI